MTGRGRSMRASRLYAAIAGAIAISAFSVPARAHTTGDDGGPGAAALARSGSRGARRTPRGIDGRQPQTGRFGARDPRTCASTAAPARGAITAALALTYLGCQLESISGNTLYLAENVRVEVGGGVPYTPNLGSFEGIDVRVPLYPIRGSYVRYQCADLVREHVGPPDTNCSTYTHPKATGYCYRSTFGDWRCFMADPAAHNPENYRRGVAPPKR